MSLFTTVLEQEFNSKEKKFFSGLLIWIPVEHHIYYKTL